MLFFLILNLITGFSHAQYPRPTALIDFSRLNVAPQDGPSGQGDYSIASNTRVVSSPYGFEGLQVYSGASPLFQLVNQQTSLSQFTVALFFSIPEVGNGIVITLFEMFDFTTKESLYKLSVDHNNQILFHFTERLSNSSLVSRTSTIQLTNGFGQWYFLAVAKGMYSVTVFHQLIDNSATTLNHFQSDSMIMQGSNSLFANTDPVSMIFGGNSAIGENLTTNSTMACAFLYGARLTKWEMEDLINVCKSTYSDYERFPEMALDMFLPLETSNLHLESAYSIGRQTAPNGIAYAVTPGSTSPLGYSGVKIAADNELVGIWRKSSQSDSKFCASLYFKIDTSVRGMLFGLENDGGSIFSLGFKNNSPEFSNVLLTIFNSSSEEIAAIPGIVSRDDWNFMVVCTDKDQQLLRIFTKNATGSVHLMAVLPFTYNYDLSNNLKTVVGGAYNEQSMAYENMGVGTEMACFTRFSTMLTMCEMEQLYQGQVIQPCEDSNSAHWPRPDSIIGFWPLDEVTDIVEPWKKVSVRTDPFAKFEYIYGPFGAQKTSAARRSTPANRELAEFQNGLLAFEITLAFYAKVSGINSALISFPDAFNIEVGSDGKLTFWTLFDNNWEKFFEINFPPDIWHFVCFTYNKISGKFDIYLDESNLGTGIVDIPTEPTVAMVLGKSNYSGAMMNSPDHLSCIFLYSAVLSTTEMQQLPHVCQTSGQGVVENVVESSLSFNDILPLKFALGDTTSMPTPANLVRGVSNPSIANTKEVASLTPLQLSGSSLLNWRLEAQFVGVNLRSKSKQMQFGIVLSDASAIQSFQTNLEPVGWTMPTTQVLALLFPLQGGNFMQVMDVLDGQSRSDVSAFFNTYDLTDGCSVVIQSIEGIVSSSVSCSRNKYATYYASTNVDMSQMLGTFQTLSAQPVASLNDTYFIGYGNNQFGNSFSVVVNKFELATIDTSALIDQDPIINNRILPIPTWADLYPTHLDYFYFNESTMENWEQVQGIQNQYRSLNFLPPTDRNWRIEANVEGQSSMFSVAIVDTTNLHALQFTDGKIDNFVGFYFQQNFATPFNQLFGTKITPGLLEPAAITRSTDCELSLSELGQGVEFVLQSIGDLLTLAIQRPNKQDSSYCFSSYSIMGVAKMLREGNAKLIIQSPIDGAVNSLKFFSLGENEPDSDPTTTSAETISTTNNPASTTLAPTKTTTPTVLESAITTPTTTTASATATTSTTTSFTIEPAFLVSNAEGLQRYIPAVPYTSTQPLFIDDLLRECQDFHPDLAAPPNANQSNNLQFYFEIESLHTVDTKNEFLSIGGAILLHWTVTTCKINERTMFDNKTRQRVYAPSPSSVWVPKLKFQSSVDSNIYMKGDNFGDDLTVQLWRENSHQILGFWYILEGRFDSYCKMSLAMFPIDRQTCSIWFELSRPISLVQIDRMVSDFEWKWTFSDGEGEWKLKQTSYRFVRRMFGGEFVDGIECEVVLARSPVYYVLYVAIPVLILGVVVLATFLMQPHETDRTGLSLTALLALYVSQQQVLVSLPVIKGGVLLGDYVSEMIIFAASVAILQIFLCFISTSFNLDKNICRKRIRIIRVIDILAASCALAAFVFIHLKTIVVVQKM